jgi:hypothetical protein
MPKASITEDTTTLSMALLGFEMEKKKIDEKIAEIRAHLGHSTAAPAKKRGRPKKSVVASASTATVSSNGTGTATKKRTMSAAARKRIAAAQRKRWAEHRKTLAAGS